jgi:alpha-beta hydrolase superfamily lysophospholipase
MGRGRFPINVLSLYLLLGSVLLCGCSMLSDLPQESSASHFDPEQALQDMAPLNLARSYKPTPSINGYFNYYSLNPNPAKHYFGSVPSGTNALAAHVFIPPKPRGTVFLLHGYFDHTGSLQKLIRECVARNYAVASMDLPGHGLSSGLRMETGTIGTCAKHMNNFLQATEQRLPRPFHMIAHSTGCAIGLEFLHSNPNPFDRIVFLAPLIRHEQWILARSGYYIARPFTDTLPRRFRKNSSDEAYCEFVKQDPLHSDSISMNFLETVYAWNGRAMDYPLWPGTIRIIQGDLDRVVDWRYNLDFLQEKIQHPEIIMIEGAMHQLANESEPIRNRVFSLIFNHID